MHDPARIHPLGASARARVYGRARARARGDRRRLCLPAVARGLACVLLLVATAAGCASSGEPSGGPSRADDTEFADSATSSLLYVNNRNWLDMKVYGIRAADRIYLMSVTSMRTDSVALPSSLLGGAGFHIIADPVGSVEPYRTTRVYMRPGQTVWLRIENVLGQSSVWVH